jgi:hypothetical protein
MQEALTSTFFETCEKEITMLYAITSYFNPCHYANRLKNYHLFREHLNVPLIAIELGFNGHFDLDAYDAEIMVRIEDGDVMFQKERLLNILIESYIPDDCTEIAWLDCDIVFTRDDWAEATSEALKHSDFVQPFEFAYQANQTDRELNNLDASKVELNFSFANRAQRADFDPRKMMPYLRAQNYGRTGLAWAARRDCLEGIGLFDQCIIGSGDCALPSLMKGMEASFQSHLSSGPMFDRAFEGWSHQIRQRSGMTVDCISGTLVQLWHGDYTNRQYDGRHHFLSEQPTDAVADLVLGDEGAWRWATPNSEIAQYVSDYFWSRQEDTAAVG